MTTPGVRELIWLSVKPLIRIAIPAAVGFTLVKRKLFPGEGTKALSLLIINFTLPCLLFSKIVPSFTPDDVHALGPIILAAFFYQALPGVLGVLARAVTETPHCFRYGILFAYMFGNWGDLPTAVVYSIAANAPFNGASDEALGIAYVSGFILVNYISSFPLQGLRLVQVDYHHPPNPVRELRYKDGEFGLLRKYAD
ncbi:Protein M3 [Rhodotorula toruloides]